MGGTSGVNAPEPRFGRILTLELYSSLGTAPGIEPLFSRIDDSTRETSLYFCLRCFVGSYFSFFFHIERAMAAILRAIVSLARFGFVPAAISRS
jgi:hypothetical protein